MKRYLNIAVALLLVVLLIGYMVTYTVRFNEAAIVTTFGSTAEGSVKNAPREDGRGGDEAGLHFKLPWPIQQVAARYDTRVQVAEGALEQALTADQQSVIVRVYITWRIVDPLQFYKALGNMGQAEQALRTRARDSQNLIGRYRFDQLASTDDSQLRLEELGQLMRERIQSRVDDLGYGIRVEEVGIKTVTLPSQVTESVFNRMRQERTTLASRARDEGEAERASLEAEAQSLRDIILSFANRQASTIRVEGEQRAAEQYARFAEDQELASFLAQLDALRQIAADRTRFFIDADKFYPFTLLGDFMNDQPAPAPAPQDGGSVEPDSGRQAGANGASNQSDTEALSRFTQLTSDDE